ncbi:dymeclin isoform X2 [Gallus gallus]|uniref:Dymeclin n=1 Tax=Gallus gallus TaxID=9031 RepID=DYM_CHICK|nr:dymeclin [Gallus gallus]XP_040511426.1 dymeclin isoform X2 [Gallus gallus]XP_040511428.1 dymeclin isoform X2 [Gallus gallus]XP_046761264.1 dymeclin isoform X2 [Gallus gallus]XP_046761266.1 dymeclin isoform X2 [Gallus gallus]XP_046761267.1 dymeclin isoform X2 [Gallus gallus]XP_046790928.1 dymeclin isoform X2 [Gallus gallus]XP_046790929.1 dymeclin isoform X2 [Gallus gallus]XP_046790930.1 dymeclin isoform X2 [Gallus gallus]XP_046790931.1 dymeclin isoform X2 [Gallus gallus]XP_046790932.1 d|eukprot:NP_001026569.1 dymeclin [Gallus gallus]
MGANSSSISELPDNEYLKKLSGAEPISENDPFWNQLLSFSFTTPTNSADLKLLEEATVSVCKSLVEKNPRTGNLGSLIKVFLSRTKELKISAECQNHLFIWQAHNALFIICCLLKVFISRMSEEELQLHFTYEDKTPGSYGTECEDLIEELLCCLIQLIVEIPLLDITYSISLEAVTTLIVFLSCQLFHKEILRESLIHKYLMRGRCLPYTSRLVKTLLYNFIRQERSPPPGSHVFQQQTDGGGLLYGIASGVATGLWTVFTLGGVGSKATPQLDQCSPLANQSLLLLLVLANLTDAPDTPNPYRQAIMSFKNTQDSSAFSSSHPHVFQINFNSLYTALCEQQKSDQATLLLYMLLHQNGNVRTYVLARTDIENLVLPILEILYHVEERNSHHVYMALIILLILTEDDGFNRSIHEVILKNITWYAERVLTEISLGSLLILVVIRTIQYNMTRTRDKYLHTNCLAALANMSAQFRSLHQYAAQRIISLFSLLSKKHNKVLEQATQSLRGSLDSNDSPLPDYAQDLNVIEEVIRMMLEIINSCLTNSLHHNPNLVYALLYKRDLFEQFRTHPSFQDIMQNIDLVISFFSSRLEHAGAELSVERVLEIIKQGAVALPKDRLRKFPELKFKYVEEEQPEEFFIPYVWSLVYNAAVALYWNPRDIQLFTMDSG